jgi:hypothetical protein
MRFITSHYKSGDNCLARNCFQLSFHFAGSLSLFEHSGPLLFRLHISCSAMSTSAQDARVSEVWPGTDAAKGGFLVPWTSPALTLLLS